jgi:methionyl-tRNA formyltransferase
MRLVFLGVNDVGMRVYDWLCNRDGIEVLAMATTEEQLELVRKLTPDLVVSVGYDHRVPEDVLSIPPMGCLNLHPSLLPYNRGKSPNVWSIVDDTPAGVTLHYMDADIDTGDVIAQREVETTFADTGRDLHQRLERAAFDLFVETWPSIEDGTIEAEPQPEPVGPFHTVEEFQNLCEIDPQETFTAKQLLNRLRALTFEPFDNAYVTVDGERYYVDVEIRPASASDDDSPEGFLESY